MPVVKCWKCQVRWRSQASQPAAFRMVCRNAVPYCLCRHLLGCSELTCGLDHSQAAGTVTGGRAPILVPRLDGCLGLYPSASGKRTGTESLQIANGFRFQQSPRCPDARGQGTSVDGVVFVGKHGNIKPTSKGRHTIRAGGCTVRIIRVFEQSKRAVPVFKDKHLSTSWTKRSGCLIIPGAELSLVR